MQLIIENISCIDLKGPEEWTPLHMAIEKGHTRIAKLLLNSQKLRNKNPTTEGGWTPLHQAARHGFQFLELYEIIISNLFNKNPESFQDSTTPLHLAAKHGHLSICQLILHNIQGD